ncbi:hypothetical protein ACIPYS_10150 [Kitasatospora sp. NPDC089913]|uniref:hypothetical protein n=1 Tax=Kitasatospora sp. NPDC089913 TaxID=3364080 RepID=UPI00381B5CB3
MPADRDLPETDTQYEQDLSAAMARAGETFHTEPLPLVDTGWSYGRRLRRRRRASVLAGAAALALVGVGGVALAGLPGGGTGRVAAAGAPSAGATAAPVSGQEFLDLLTPLLPAGSVVQVGEARGTESGTPQVRLTHDDGNGRVQYLFSITRGRSVPAGGDGCAYATAPDSCTQTVTADGSLLVLYRAGTRDGEPAGSKMWSAKLDTTSGYELLLQEWNREPLEQGSGITRVDPPMTPDRMAEVVTDQRWTGVLAAIPEHPVVTLSTAGAGTGGSISGTLFPFDPATFPRPWTGQDNGGASPSPSPVPPSPTGPSAPELPSTEGALSGPLTLPAFPPPGP